MVAGHKQLLRFLRFVAAWLLGCLLNSFVLSHFIISSCGTAQRPCIRDMLVHAACN